MQKYTIKDFNKAFPNDDVCLEWLKNHLYPDGIHCKVCDRVTKHHRITTRKSYSCDVCGNHMHPTAGTIYHKSSTPLTLWFYAVYQMAQTRCGISAKQLQRETGVTYKTAWRMFKQIRKMLDESGDTEPLSGEVECDETYLGGQRRGSLQGRPGKASPHKTAVFGMVQRKGRIVASTVPNVQKATLQPRIQERILPSSTVYTDEMSGYNGLGRKGYQHKRIKHSQKIYVCGDTHTNSIEGFWSLLKSGLRGVYHSVGIGYVQSYLNEYTFRYNRRNQSEPMFVSILTRVRKN